MEIGNKEYENNDTIDYDTNLQLNIAISTDIKRMENHINISPGSGHNKEEEVEVKEC